ncbi:hypothetical protein JCM8115_000736 [Rhodotorula mucilaginosa]|uniref:Epoxide hydrolase N-terminal domain-containing protein n=1 Tax=Rhodotorula mucilaginosa TaxID=5537 RepID=A0A9P6W2G3_RHOMI|nr:hypothetical protein C6P46_004548 [Rhodotorula mucilaginosa]TKA56962.1 hypothetical protein B0A53_01363 [Rhodotorula sp. CCFEE 5036]
MPARTLTLRPFSPSFTASELDGLARALEPSRLPGETYASRQTKYGIKHAWMKNALQRWKDGFDWKKHEQEINEVDHYMVQVQTDGVQHDLHVIYHESKDPNAIPLLLLHGWPGSAFEFIEAIKILRKSTSPAFHLIAPMEPGYGWSTPPPLDRGFNMNDCTALMNDLMVGLGYGDGYAAQGGDIGSGLARLLAVNYDACKCININYMPAVAPPEDAPERHQIKPHEEDALRRADEFQKTGRGYANMHATRPGTIGIVVGSSPVALLAWIAEKYLAWTDEDPPLDTILAICTIWWIRDSYPSSIWAYADFLETGISALHNDPKYRLDKKPFGFSSFKEEISATPEAWAGRNGNLQFYRYHDKGGHFAALEQPEAFAQDMQDCFGKIWPLSQQQQS